MFFYFLRQNSELKTVAIDSIQLKLGHLTRCSIEQKTSLYLHFILLKSLVEKEEDFFYALSIFLSLIFKEDQKIRHYPLKRPPLSDPKMAP